MHLLFSYIFIIRMDMALVGTGLSLFIAYLTMLIMMLVYSTYQDDIKEAMVYPDMRIFKDLGAYAWLGLPYTLMVVLDQWAWELLILLAGFWTVDEQASQIILVTITSVCYMCGLGLDQTACAIIGFQIGAVDVIKAKKYYALLFIVGLWIVSIQAGFLYCFQEMVVATFTSNNNMQLIVNNLMIIIIVSSIPDSLKGMLKGVIKALGLQKQCAIVNLLGHWGINLTLCMMLGFYFEWRLFGLWTAKIILEIYVISSYALLIHCQNWEEIAEKAHNRLEKDDTRALILKELQSPLPELSKNERRRASAKAGRITQDDCPTTPPLRKHNTSPAKR